MPLKKPASKIPSLDGLRAVSIALVVVGHLANGYGLENGAMRVFFGNAALGVSVFFVISGFLITTLLLREYDVTEKISISKFYFRRAFRILPAYYFYLAVVVVLGLLGELVLPKYAIVSSGFFLWDYWPVKEAWYLDHLWSLAVEEQFYLLWPFVLLIALHKGNKKLAATIALAVIVASPFIRVATYYLAPESLQSHLYYMFHTRADSLMFGALCALTINLRVFEKIYQSLANYVWLAALFVLVISPLLTRYIGGAYIYVFGYTLEGASISLIMIWLIRNPVSKVGRVFNSRLFVQIGIMSYSIYLWQTLFLDASNSSVTGIFPLSLLLIFVCASISFYWVERPMLRLRHRISQGFVGRQKRIKSVGET